MANAGKTPIALSADLLKADREYIRTMIKRYPFLLKKHWGGCMRWLRNRFAKVLLEGGGNYGTQPFAPKDPLTVLLHGNRPFGGGFPRRALAKMWFGPGHVQRIGIYDKEPAFRAFGTALQTGESRRMTKPERRFLARVRRIRLDPLNPPRYERTARPFVRDFAFANFPEMVHEVRTRLAKTCSSEAALAKAKADAEMRARRAAARAAKGKR